MLKRLFHLSLEEIQKFTPCIPKNRRIEENGELKRICLSDSIENCLSAVSWFGSGQSTEDLLNEEGSKIIFVYEFMVDSNLLCNPKEVYEQGHVIDALLNNEYWYIGSDELIPVKKYAISLTDYDEEEHNVLSHKMQKLYDLNNGDIELDECYDRENGLYYANVFKIFNIQYEVVTDVITGDSFSITYEGVLIKNLEDIVKSAFDSQLCDYDYKDNCKSDNLPQLKEVYKEDKILEFATQRELSLDKNKLMNYIKNNGINVLDIIAIE